MQEHSNSTRLKHLPVQSEKLVSRKPEEPSYQVVRNVLKWTLWKTFSCLVFYVAFDPVSRFSGRPAAASVCWERERCSYLADQSDVKQCPHWQTLRQGLDFENYDPPQKVQLQLELVNGPQCTFFTKRREILKIFQLFLQSFYRIRNSM